MLTTLGLMCNSILKCIFCYPQFLIFINFCNNNLNVIFLKIYGAMIYWYFLIRKLKRHNKLGWHILKTSFLKLLMIFLKNLPARIFLQVMTDWDCTHIYIEVSISVKMSQIVLVLFPTISDLKVTDTLFTCMYFCKSQILLK